MLWLNDMGVEPPSSPIEKLPTSRSDGSAPRRSPIEFPDTICMKGRRGRILLSEKRMMVAFAVYNERMKGQHTRVNT